MDFYHGVQQRVRDAQVLQDVQHVRLLVHGLRVTDVSHVEQQVLEAGESGHAQLAADATGTLRTECWMSSKVAEKESMSWWGSWDRKPMVSTYRTLMRLGSWPAWTVTSRVAKSWFLGCSRPSPVSARIRVVFPGDGEETRATC